MNLSEIPLVVDAFVEVSDPYLYNTYTERYPKPYRR